MAIDLWYVAPSLVTVGAAWNCSCPASLALEFAMSCQVVLKFVAINKLEVVLGACPEYVQRRRRKCFCESEALLCECYL